MSRMPWQRLCAAALSIAMILASVGCEPRTEAPLAPDLSTSESTSDPILYAGSETLDDVKLSIPKVEKALGITLSPAEQAELLRDFDRHEQNRAPALGTACVDYPAYGWSWFYTGKTDLDMKLEYKWNSGGRTQGYQIITYSWTIYWIVQNFYGGKLWNWTWLEGTYQRVTVVIGAKIWVGYSTYQQSFLRSWIVVRVCS